MSRFSTATSTMISANAVSREFQVGSTSTRRLRGHVDSIRERKRLGVLSELLEGESEPALATPYDISRIRKGRDGVSWVVRSTELLTPGADFDFRGRF
jgi:hypothetical protein